jgi:hypothetical protein
MSERAITQNPAVTALLGTVLGGLLGLVGTFIQTTSQADAEDKRTLKTLRVDAYDDFLATWNVHDSETVVRCLSIMWEMDGGEDDEAALEELRKAWPGVRDVRLPLDAELRRSLGRLRIVADNAVIDRVDAMIRENNTIAAAVTRVRTGEETGREALEDLGWEPDDDSPLLDETLAFSIAARESVTS